MIRIVIENALLFMLPTLLYVAYVWVTRQTAADASGDTASPQPGVLDDAPLLYLFVAGVALVLITLLAFGSTTGGRPDQGYTPPSIEDGKIKPGYTK